MAHRKYDLVQETSTSTGTGAMALGGAVTRRRAFGSVLSNGDTAYVLIEHGSAAEWEVCLATYATSGNQLTRGTVLASSTGSAVSFSAGTKTISLIAPASKMVVEDHNGDASVTRNLSAVAGIFGTAPTKWQPITTSQGITTVEVAAGADGRNWDTFLNSGVLYHRIVNDAYSAAYQYYTVQRTGYSITNQAWYLGAQVEKMRLDSGGLTLSTNAHAYGLMSFYGSSAAGGCIYFNDTNTGGQVWQIGVGSGNGSPNQWNMYNFGTGLITLSVTKSGKIGAGVIPTQAMFETSAADGTHLLGLRGTTKGIRVVTNSVASSIEGVSADLVTSYQPIYLNGSYIGFSISGSETFRMFGGGFRPNSDAAVNLGDPSYRWGTVYAATGAIDTSGRAAKVGIREATDAERRAARRILDGGPKLYRFKDAYEVKGDAARLHAGYIAEDVRDALEAEGLDPWRYGFMCADDLTRTEEYTVEVERTERRIEPVTISVERPKVRKVEVSERAVEVIDGKPVMVTRTVEHEEPVGRTVPVTDESGDAVMVPVGEPDAEGNVRLVPMLYFVHEMETVEVFELREVEVTEAVEESRTREVPTGETRLGLRYSELEAFLKCAV